MQPRKSSRIRQGNAQLIQILGRVPTAVERAALLAQQRDEALQLGVGAQREILQRRSQRIAQQENPYARQRRNYRNIQRGDEGQVIFVETRSPVKKEKKPEGSSGKKKKSSKKEEKIIEESEEEEETPEPPRRQKKKEKRVLESEESEEEVISKKEKVSQKAKKEKKNWFISSEMGFSDPQHLKYNHVYDFGETPRIIPEVNMQEKFQIFEREVDDAMDDELEKFIKAYLAQYSLNLGDLEDQLSQVMRRRAGSPIQILHQAFLVINNIFFEYEQRFFTQEIITVTAELQVDYYNVFDRSRQNLAGGYFANRLKDSIFLRPADVDAGLYEAYSELIKNFLCQDMSAEFNLKGQIYREDDISMLGVYARTLVDWVFEGQELNDEIEIDNNVFTEVLFENIVDEFNKFITVQNENYNTRLGNIIHFANPPIRSLLRYVNLIFLLLLRSENELVRRFCFAFFHPSLSNFAKDWNNMTTIWQVLGHDFFCKFQAGGFIPGGRKNYVGKLVYNAKRYVGGVETILSGKEKLPLVRSTKAQGQHVYSVVQFQNLGRIFQLKTDWNDPADYKASQNVWGNPKFIIFAQYFLNQLTGVFQAQNIHEGPRFRPVQYNGNNFQKLFSIAHLITVYHCEMKVKQLIQVNRHYKIYNQALIELILTTGFEENQLVNNLVPAQPFVMAEIEEFFASEDLFEAFPQLAYQNKYQITLILFKYILMTSIYSASYVLSRYFRNYVLENSNANEQIYRYILTFVCELGDSKDEFVGGGLEIKPENEDGETYSEAYGSGRETFSDPMNDLIRVHFYGEEPQEMAEGTQTDFFTYAVVKSSVTFCRKAGAISKYDDDGEKVYSVQRKINAILMGKDNYQKFSNGNVFVRPLDYFTFQTLPPLAEKTFTPLVLRPYLCPTFQLIEECCPERNCVQVLTIFLFYISNLLGDDLVHADLENKESDLNKFLDNAVLNQNVIFQVAEIINQVQTEYGQQINNTVEIKLKFINFDCTSLTLAEFKKGPRDLINIPIKVKKEYENLLIIIFKGHLIPIYFDDDTDLVSIHKHLQQNQFFKILGDAKKQTQIIQKLGQGSLQILPGVDKDKMYMEYKEINSLQQSQEFYNKFFEKLKIKQNKIKILIFYDIETTANLKTTLEPSSEMIPYLLVYAVTAVGLDLQKISPQPRGRYFGQPVKLLGGTCTQTFVRDIADIYAVLVEHQIKNFEIIAMGWNSAKFDVQFLLPHLYKQFPLEIDLVGVPSNPKCLSLGKSIKFWDAMQVCSRQTLESFCNSMGVKGKLECPEIFEIKRIQDVMANQTRISKIVDYCVQDVLAMQEAVLKFNQKIVELVSSFRGQEPLKNTFILSQTIASTSFKNFTKYLIPPSLLPQPLNEEAPLDAARKSYRGGYVQCFAFGSVRAQPQNPLSPVHKITYIDINSLYPSVMDKLPLPLAIQDNQVQDFARSLRGEKIFFHYECQNLYELYEFKLPNFMCYGFFPIRIFDSNGAFLKIIYPLEWKSNQYQKSLWVWGHEIRCLVEIIRRYAGERELKDDEVVFRFSSKYEYEFPRKVFPQMGLMYKERLKYKELKDIPMADTTKIQMNSLYGKFGQNAYATYFYMNDFMAERMLEEDFDLLLELNFLQKSQGNKEKLKDWFPKSQTYKFANSQSNLYRYPVMEQNSYLPQAPQQRLVYVSSQIANAARCVLLATLYTLQSSGEFLPLYSDTDSIIYGSTARGQELIQLIKQNPGILENENFPLRPITWDCQNAVGHNQLSASVRFTGDLGDMKIEKDDISQVKLFAPKFYRVYDKDGKSEDKSKGVNLRMRLDVDEKESALLNQEIKDKLFDDFENDLKATVFQSQIRSKDGQMIQSAYQKQLTFNLTRKIQPPNDDKFQLATIFQNSQEYENQMKKQLINQNDFFIYQ